jgi:hypothetical protein
MLDEKQTVEDIAESIFGLFNAKLAKCLYIMKLKLNEIFSAKIDDLYSELIESINQAKRGTSMSDLLDEIKLSNTEVNEHVRTVCEWFSLKKSTQLEKIELEKLVQLAIKCFQQINNCEINVKINKVDNYYIPGSHLYVLVLCLINFLNNSYKFSKDNLIVTINISGDENEKFRISISNQMSERAKGLLHNGHFEQIRLKLINMNDSDLLLNNGGSGLYKCLHALKMYQSLIILFLLITTISSRWKLLMDINILVVEDNEFKRKRIVEIIHSEFQEIKVNECHSFTSAWQMITRFNYDLVLLDMSLPTFDKTSTNSGGDFRFSVGKNSLEK